MSSESTPSRKELFGLIVEGSASHSGGGGMVAGLCLWQQKLTGCYILVDESRELGQEVGLPYDFPHFPQ